MVAVAQLVRAPDCGSGGRGFNSPQPPHPSPKGLIIREIHVFRGFPGRGPGPARRPGRRLNHPRGRAAGGHRQAEKERSPKDHPDRDANGTPPHELPTLLLGPLKRPKPSNERDQRKVTAVTNGADLRAGSQAKESPVPSAANRGSGGRRRGRQAAAQPVRRPSPRPSPGARVARFRRRHRARLFIAPGPSARKLTDGAVGGCGNRPAWHRRGVEFRSFIAGIFCVPSAAPSHPGGRQKWTRPQIRWGYYRAEYLRPVAGCRALQGVEDP